MVTTSLVLMSRTDFENSCYQWFRTVRKIVDFNCKKVTYRRTKIRPLITGQVSKAYGYLQQNSFLPEKHWSIVVKFLSKSIVIKLTSKWSQLSGRGVAQLNVVNPKFADFFRWRRFTRRNHCVLIFATFPLTQGDLLENQEERSWIITQIYNSGAWLRLKSSTYFSVMSGATSISKESRKRRNCTRYVPCLRPDGVKV